MKTFYTLLFFVCFSALSHSQVRPYKATVYDSTLTGYYFLSSINFLGGAQVNYLMILDNFGDVVFYKALPAGVNANDFKMQNNGMVSVNTNGKYYLMDSTFTIVDSVYCKNGYATDIHELQVLPNGHYLLLGNEITVADLSSYNYFKNGAYGSKKANLGSTVIQEQDALKNVVFEWHTKDHFSFDGVDKFWLSDTLNVDWTHSNALELDTDGNILLSTRHFNEITKINRSDSSIMWRMGGKYNQFTFLNSPVPFFGQHDIRRIANGHVTLYDNGNHNVTHGARALEFELDEANKTADLKWSYTYDSTMFSRGTGNAQRHANSNTLIDWGIVNKNNICFTVVKPNGSKAFQLSFIANLFSYRSFYYPTLPFTFKRPVVNCSSVSGNVVLDAGAGYPSYLWNNGATTQTITVTTPDTFYVSVPYGIGFITSVKKIISNLTTACSPNAVSEIQINHKLQVIPNPVAGYFRIADYDEYTNGVPEIYNTLGERVYPEGIHERGEVDCKNLSPGLYIVKLKDETLKFIKQ